ncbi:ankyrin repeat domain-containing protein [Pseudonocardia sp. N23]|uniref:ankyrin repeat domain-containing protein n=1 Tax=Pseudonocardia sp. N23 TaxID=1987376 RepID=UPI000BFC4712|nr:ankyrin repeat domain-containing protein [Pseudonocardia sp. N23]GAY11726.1 Ankyrin repeat [Pseudonocardia sp. N23]
MPTPVPLPQDPDLGQLRRRARELSRAARAGEAGALDLVTRWAPDRAGGDVPLHLAQLVLARMHGFDGWPPLVRHVETVLRWTWVPPTGDAAPATSGDPVDDFLSLACLRYDADDPAHARQAAQLLAAHPEIAAASVHAAAATADVEALRRLVGPGTVGADGGPNRWPPLMYLAYARHDPRIDPAAVVDAATLLLDEGADPDAGRLWHGLPSPFTVLTGVFGEGEGGPVAQPRHPAEQPLAQLLLDRGADPNDAQTLYNRMFGADDSHLVLLFAHGLGRGDGGVWRARLGHTLATPQRMLADQLDRAVLHGMAARVELLVGNGVAVQGGRWLGSTPVAATAARLGYPGIVDVLVAHGAPRPELTPVDALLAAALAGDAAAVAAAPDELRARVAADHAGVIVVAAADGRLRAVELLLDLGVPVDTVGRGDAGGHQRWNTALHEAAFRGDETLAALLLARGADATVRDARFDATPTGWAEHAGHTGLAAELAEHESRQRERRPET